MKLGMMFNDKEKVKEMLKKYNLLTEGGVYAS